MEFECKIGISARHIHLSQADADILFGKDYEFTPKDGEKGKGQYPVTEKVKVITPRTTLEKVGMILPVRPQTQFEISKTDAIAFGIEPMIRMSGDLEGTPGNVTIIGPKGQITLESGVIVANRHVHLGGELGAEAGIKDGDTVMLKCGGEGRELIFDDVKVKMGPKGKDALVHLDTDEGNAANLPMWATGVIITK